MRHEPTDLKETITNLLIAAYGIDPVKITFIPVGEESISYNVETETHSFIAKFNNNIASLEQTERTHSLLMELKNLSFIIPPIESNHQKTVHTIKNGYVSVFPFIKGPLVVEENQDFHEELLKKLVEICSTLHKKTTEIHSELLEEDFNTTYEHDFAYVLEQAKQNQQKQYSQIAFQHEKKIQKLIQENSKQNEYYKKNKPRNIITHGDITGLNMIQVPGDIKLVDWDGCMLAPKERDLIFLIDNPHFNREEYLQLVNENNIDELLIEYYKLRWVLDSIVLNLKELATNDFAEVDEKVKLTEIGEYLKQY